MGFLFRAMDYIARRMLLRCVVTTTIALAAGLLLFVTPSVADCTPTEPGVVVCSGQGNDGLVATGPVAVTVSSDGQIDSGGISISGAGDSRIVNHGNVSGDLVSTDATNFLIDQNGLTNHNISVTGTTETNTLIIRPGHSVNTVVMSGADNIVDNAGGTVNSSLTLTATTGLNSIINRTGSFLNTVTLNGSSATIDNAGTINQTVTHNGSGPLNVINREGATISGAITSTGSSADRVDNAGIINNGASLGAGNDYFINRAGGTSGYPVANGTIDMGTGNDYFIMAGGTVNGDIRLGDGVDIAAISGGRITTSVQGDAGNDFILWSGGTIASGLYGDSRDVPASTGDDSAIFSNLTSANLTPGLIIDGGLGYDRLAWQNTRNAGGGNGTNVDTLRNWELIALARGSQLTFEYGDNILILGDAGTLTGQLSIEDATSSVIASLGNNTVRSADGTSRVTVSNAGLIDMVTGSPTNQNHFIVMGDYVGNDGLLALQTYLDTDSNVFSDQLVINGANGGGTGTGSTGLVITNFGGPGAQTVANGILVVDAQNGATTSVGSFSLTGPVAAGIFEYQLFQGGVTPDAATDSDWFLRSSVAGPTIPTDPTPITPTVPVDPAPPIITVPEPPPEPPPQPPIPTDPTPITPTVPVLPPDPITPTVPVLPELPDPVAPPVVEPPGGGGGGGDIPLIRPEIPGYVVTPLIAAQLGLEELGTFHERQGNQSLLDAYGKHPRGWMRAFGEIFNSAWSPRIEDMSYEMDPKFDGHLWGLQLGADLYGRQHDDGSEDRAGLFYSHGQAEGDIVANSLARLQVGTGRLGLMSDGLGGYFTYVNEGGWYFDAVALASWLHGGATSYRDIGNALNGYSLSGSAEAGLPVAIGDTWTIEPQVQLIVQHIALGDSSDPFTSIAYSPMTSVTGRVGVRVEADTELGDRPTQFFASADLWHRLSTESTVQFNEDIVHTMMGGTSLELQAGLNTKMTDAVSAFGLLSYETAVDGRPDSSFGASVGFKVNW